MEKDGRTRYPKATEAVNNMATRNKRERRMPTARHKPPNVKADETYAAYLARKVSQAIQRGGWVGNIPPVGVIISDEHCIVSVSLPTSYRGTGTDDTVIAMVQDELEGRRIGEPYGMCVVVWLSLDYYQKVTRSRYKGKKHSDPLSAVAANDALVREVNRIRHEVGKAPVGPKDPMTKSERYLALRGMESKVRAGWDPSSSRPDIMAATLTERVPHAHRESLKADSEKYERIAREVAANAGRILADDMDDERAHLMNEDVMRKFDKIMRLRRGEATAAPSTEVKEYPPDHESALKKAQHKSWSNR